MSAQNIAVLRIAEIKANLAASKYAFFESGIVRPLRERLALESELAQLQFEHLRAKTAERYREMQVRQLRGQLLRERLELLGLAHLIDECNVQAESEISTPEKL